MTAIVRRRADRGPISHGLMKLRPGLQTIMIANLPLRRPHHPLLQPFALAVPVAGANRKRQQEETQETSRREGSATPESIRTLTT